MEEKILNIENIRNFVINYKIDWTNHCLNRLTKRDISISDVKFAINNGKIIEYYYDDYPFPSCLILGTTKDTDRIHIVCGISDSFVHIITAYYPDSDIWEEDMKTRRGK